VGLSLAEFDLLTPVEFNLTLKGYISKQEKALDNQLWQTRYLSSIIASFSSKTKKAVEPKKFFLLPGEKKENQKKAALRDLDKLSSGAKALLQRLNKKD
tara:strand:+ start:7437 stop:7733 length:297 start_codon:yes stop_codon:yes gene_type:complete